MNKVTQPTEITKEASTGERISYLRRKLNWRQEDLANKICISRDILANYETDRRDIPFDKLLLIANALNTSIDFLIGRSQVSAMRAEYMQISNVTGLSEKSIKILSVVNNLDVIDTINVLIEQEEMFLYGGFSPITHKGMTQEEYDKEFEKALNRYEKEIEKVENSCIPIISCIHNYLKTEITDEETYIINGNIKRLRDLNYKVDRLLAEETLSTNEMIENTFLEKIKNQVKKLKNKVMGGNEK